MKRASKQEMGDTATIASSRAHPLEWLGLLGILTIGVMRCMIVFTPRPLFDFDPLFDPTSNGMIGPAGSLALDGALLMACLMALIGLMAARHPIAAWMFICALAPLPIVIAHSMEIACDLGHLLGNVRDAGDLWRGFTWCAGMFAAVTLAHLVQRPQMRIVATSILIAALAPIVIRGMSQVFIEHVQTIREFEQNKAIFFESKGWAADSTQALLYERRLRQPEPLGWFATTNIFASLCAAGTLACAALMTSWKRMQSELRWLLIPGALMIVLLSTVALSGSRGAIGACALGAVALAVVTLIKKEPVRLSLIILLCALPLAGVVMRGSMLSIDVLNERSLLFRWHYLIGAWRIFIESPCLGAGPDGFQDAFVAVRPANCPEEVTSAHSMFIDWVSMLGFAGIAWLVLIVAAFVLSSRTIHSDDRCADANADRMTLYAGLFVTLLGLLPALLIEAGTLNLDTSMVATLMRCAGLIAFLLIATLFASCMRFMPMSRGRLAALAGGLALIIHNQIEMTLYQPGAAVWCMLLVGVAAGTGATQERRKFAVAIAAIVAVVLIWLIPRAVVPAVRQAARVQTIAIDLARAAEHPELVPRERLRASDALFEAYRLWPANPSPLIGAIDQRVRAAGYMPPDDRHDALDAAFRLASLAVEEHDSIHALSDRAVVAQLIATTTQSMDYWQHALDDAQEIARRDPHGTTSWTRMGDIQWAMHRPIEAAHAYERALLTDAQLGLDPLKQLPEDQRTEIQRRIDVALRAPSIEESP